MVLDISILWKFFGKSLEILWKTIWKWFDFPTVARGEENLSSYDLILLTVHESRVPEQLDVHLKQRVDGRHSFLCVHHLLCPAASDPEPLAIGVPRLQAVIARAQLRSSRKMIQTYRIGSNSGLNSLCLYPFPPSSSHEVDPLYTRFVIR